MNLPDFSYELPLWEKGFDVIGIDEVGRGAFAGPVVVGGVIFDSEPFKNDKEYILSLGINDSKKLTPKKREELAKIIRKIAVCEVVFIDVATINEIGIGKATFLGMKKVAEKMSEKISNPHLLIDAFQVSDINLPQKGIIHGDCLSISIAAASIIAKVARDEFMRELSPSFNKYFWAENKGYGTLKHRNAISEFGLSEYHRRAFCSKITRL